MSADSWGTCPQCGREETLREDYEFYWKDGTFHAVYSGVCQYGPGWSAGGGVGCGFDFQFEHSETPVMSKAKAPQREPGE